MNPAQSVPLIVASGGPREKFSARSGRWLAAPMKKSIGMEKRTLVREATPARPPAPAAAGLAGLPAAVSMALAITIFCFGQITNQTLAHMKDPRIPPRKIAQP